MTSIIVNRFKNPKHDIKYGTFGYIDLLGFRIHTVEQPWTYDPVKWPYGKPGDSCIPAGTYELVTRYSNRKGKEMTYLKNESLGVYVYSGPKPFHRGSCMFHLGARPEHIEGCIGVGVEMGERGGLPSLERIDLAERFIYDYIKTFQPTKCEIVYV